MISVGVDVSKGKSTVCILKPYGEILMAPKDYPHTQSDMSNLVTKLKAYDEKFLNMKSNLTVDSRRKWVMIKISNFEIAKCLENDTRNTSVV